MIELDPSQKAPLYEQLYAALADEIRTGQRAAGTPLPGRRTMAAQQGVSVNTVDTAYQMLAAEGLAEARPRSGFYVQSTYGMLHIIVYRFQNRIHQFFAQLFSFFINIHVTSRLK